MNSKYVYVYLVVFFVNIALRYECKLFSSFEYYLFFSCFFCLDINLNPAKINVSIGEDLDLQWKQPENYVSTVNAKLKYNVRLDFFK